MLDVIDITVKFGDREVLRDISFNLRPGRMIALLGPNGAGKTTLIRSLNGLLPIAKGRIEIDGRPIDSYSRREIAERIAVVAQENETKFPVTVREYVLAGRFARGRAVGWESDADISFADEALASCDLTEFAGRLMNELSGGERQRAVLARALAAETKVLLLDEPTANLDLKHQALMFGLVRDRCKRFETAAVVITHDLNLASEFADDAMLMCDGRVFAQGRIEDVLAAENIKKVFGVDVLQDRHPSSGKARITAIY